MKILKYTLFVVLSIVLINCSSDIKHEESKPKTPEELRAELKSLENNNPLDYLFYKEVTLQPQNKLVKKETFFRSAVYENDGALIEGLIINQATLAKYKDIVVKVMYYSQTETMIQSKSYVLYEYFSPNSENYFSIKVYPPKEYKNFNIRITKAKPV